MTSLNQIKRLLDDLESDGPLEIIVVVDWDPDPKPPEDGTIVVTWDDIEGDTIDTEHDTFQPAA